MQPDCLFIYTLIILLLVRGKHLPNHSRKNCANCRGNNKYPQIGKRLTTFKQSRTNRTSRIH